MIQSKVRGGSVSQAAPLRRAVTGSPAVLILALGSLSGCATGTLSAGTTLAAAGQQAATQMAQNVDISSATLQQFKLALAFDDGFNKQPDASSPLVGEVGSWQANLKAYSQVLQDLANAYAALGLLAADNATSSFDTATGNLTSSINAFAKLAGSSKPPLSASVSTIVETAGSAILASYQAQEVREASDALLVRLNQIISILTSDDVRHKVVPGAGLVAKDIDQAAFDLYVTGGYSYMPLANQIGQPLGLTATTSFDATVAKNPNLMAGLRNAVVETIDAQIAAIGASYDKSEALLEALRPLHAAVDSGTQIDPATVNQLVGQLQTLATALQPPKTSSSGSK